MNDIHRSGQSATIVRNTNDTIELTLSGELNRTDLEKVLQQLLLHIVQLRDEGRKVLIFVDTADVEDTGDRVSDVALKFLQTDFDFMAIYDQSFGHRLVIGKLARTVTNGDRRINVFKTVDEATEWVDRMRRQATENDL